MPEPEYIVKSGLSIIHGPCDWDEAKATAFALNSDYQTDEYRVEEFDLTRINF